MGWGTCSDDFVDLIGDMMEKDPAQRIQSAVEVAERLSPWAADNSPLLTEELDDKPRWTPAPVASMDAQDTDPNFDVADLAMSEISDATSMQMTSAGGDSATDTGSFVSAGSKPAVPQSTVSQYSNAKHLKDEATFGIYTMIFAAATFFAIGTLAGFIAGFFAGQ